MNEEQLDQELADWFDHRREIEAANAPPFADVWTEVRAGHERAQRRASLRRVAAIAAMLALFGILVSMVQPLFAPHPSAQSESASLAVPWRTTVLISGWQAPTDFLSAAADTGFASLAREAQRWNKDSTFHLNQIN